MSKTGGRLLAVVVVLACSVVPVLVAPARSATGAEADSASSSVAAHRKAERDRIARERDALTARRQQEEAVCYQRFAVEDCLRGVRAKARETHDRLRAQEIELNDAERREKAAERLRAIEEFSDLGSGFNIAMQDLDIRGAGNLLGAEQSGFIADIGFETYQKIMNEAIAELRAEGLQVAGLGAAEQDVVEQMHYVDDAHIEIEVEAGLPDAYVAQQAERLKLYRELDSTKDEAALQAFESRLADRFGPLPREAQELLNVVRLRWEAIRLGIERVKVKNGLMILHFVGEQNSPYYKSDTFMELLRKVTQNPARFVLKQHNNRLAMTVRNVKDIEDGYKTLQQL